MSWKQNYILFIKTKFIIFFICCCFLFTTFKNSIGFFHWLLFRIIISFLRFESKTTTCLYIGLYSKLKEKLFNKNSKKILNNFAKNCFHIIVLIILNLNCSSLPGFGCNRRVYDCKHKSQVEQLTFI